MIEILPVIIFAPLLGAVCVSLVQGDDSVILSRNCRDVGMLSTGMVFILSVLVYMDNDTHYVISLISDIYLNYNIHANVFSKTFILGITLCAAMTVWVSYFAKVTNVRAFVFTVLILEFLAINIFLAQNIIMLVMLVEISFYIIVLQVYSINDRRGAYQLLFIVFVSLLGMISVLSIVFTAKTADLSVLGDILDGDYNIQWWVLLVSFMCRLPVFLLDGWYRLLIHRSSICFTGFVATYPAVISLYAIIRVNIFTFEQIATLYAPWIMGFAILCMVVSWIQSARETDIRHSIGGLIKGSFALAMATIFIMEQPPLILCIYFIVSYTISIGGLLAVISIMCSRYNSTVLSEIANNKMRLPEMSIAGLLCMGAIGFMPFSAGFVSFMGILNVWSIHNTYIFMIVSISMVGACILSAYFYFVVFFNNKVSRNTQILFLKRSEYWFVRTLICIILLQGVLPVVFIAPLQSYIQGVL